MDDHTTSALPPEVLLRSARTVTVEQGKTVFEEGSPGEAVYLVVAGKIKINQHTRVGPGNLLAILGPGDVFGELSLFDGGARSASASAVTAATLRELDRTVLDGLLQSHAEVASWLIRQLARRLRRANDAAADLVFSDVPARLAQVLLNLAEQFGTGDDGAVLIDHGLTQLELAQLAGAARESVNRALASFAAQGWITSGSRSARILDMDALITRAGRTAKLPGPVASG